MERPPGGPPCEPLGKRCGVEQNLPQLIDAIRDVHSLSIVPYQENTHREVCEHCALGHPGFCPCPMNYLLVLVAEAVEAVDARRGGHEAGGQ